jgi:N-acetylmuramoyl-L-alanine amidase
MKVGRILEAILKIDVIYTRKNRFYRFVERAITNRANATIFVSIHCNANKNTAARWNRNLCDGV